MFVDRLLPLCSCRIFAASAASLESKPSWSEGYSTSLLHRAARRGDVEELRSLLMNPAHVRLVNGRDEAGWMPLHHAACVGRRICFSCVARRPRQCELPPQ